MNPTPDMPENLLKQVHLVMQVANSVRRAQHRMNPTPDMPENLLKQVHLVMQVANSFLNLLLAASDESDA